ncbi:hypothetical protein O181_025403 [Austropuccinia psidii MF-1]|uniref:Uncharacterized protein n=1 Tax=Austropuccinia psidii MF-1 TaxID=1389203 RepID=A0A9Q3CKL4_9BASI|nr:hypothetical protein [Austropuccinia psidii MF-1]
MPVDHLKKNLLTIHTTAKDFHDMWKRAYATDARFIDEAKEHDKKRYDNTHKEPDFREGDQIGKNSVEVRLKEEFSRKHPVFPVSLVKPYHQEGEDKFPSRKKSHNPQEIVEVEDSPRPVNKIMKAMKIELNGKDSRQYLIRLKNKMVGKRWHSRLRPSPEDIQSL